MPIDSPALSREAVQAALVDLLTTGQHHHAATPATLTAVGDARRAPAPEPDPAGPHASAERRLAALTRALGGAGTAVFTATSDSHYRRDPDTPRLLAALTELAALALGWLDHLSTTTQPSTGDSDHDDEQEPPF